MVGEKKSGSSSRADRDAEVKNLFFFMLLGPPQLETTGFTCRLREPLSGLEKMEQFGFASGHGEPENEWELF